MTFARAPYERFRQLIYEAAKFGGIGVTGVFITPSARRSMTPASQPDDVAQMVARAAESEEHDLYLLRERE